MAHETEDQELEKLKSWWAENGRSVIVGIVIGVGGLAGWNYWQNYQAGQAASASVHYAEISKGIVDNNADVIVDNFAILEGEYAATPYAALGALEVARFMALEDKLDEAERQLRWALENSPQAVVRDVAAIRLARVLMAQDKHDAALELINKEYPESYTSLREELRGDILRARGDVEAARAAYDKALAGATGNVEYLRLKRQDLGSVAESDAS